LLRKRKGEIHDKDPPGKRNFERSRGEKGLKKPENPGDFGESGKQKPLATWRGVLYFW